MRFCGAVPWCRSVVRSVVRFRGAVPWCRSVVPFLVATAVGRLARRPVDRHNRVVNHRPSRASLAFQILAAVGTLMLLSFSAWADDASDGRRRAQRASQLAAKGKCKQAIGEYDKAIAVLHDPALLFNRAECHRKLGNTEAALEDYNQFLSDLPTAPNRAQVESRIAELKKSGPPSATPVAALPPAGSAGGGGLSAGVAASAASAAKPHSRKPAEETAGPAGGKPHSGEVLVPQAKQVPGAAAGAVDGTGAGNASLVTNQETPQSAPSGATSGDSLTGRPWFWIAVGAVVVGAGIGAYVVFGKEGTSIPMSDLGNYRF